MAITGSGKGPLWTSARLRRVLLLRFGPNGAGGVDIAAVAAAFGVSARTVRRWLASRHGRELAHLPEKRLQQLLELIEPAPSVLADEAAQQRYARRAVAAWRSGVDVLPSWNQQEWLERHLVVIFSVRSAGLRQAVVTRKDSRASNELHRRGKVEQQTSVATRFHATLLISEILAEVHPWRFRAGRSAVAAGYTQAWLDDAPTVDLDRLARRVRRT